MKTTILSYAAALALVALAGCDQTPDGRAAPQSSAGAGPSQPTSSASSQVNTPSTPANIGQAQTQSEKKDGTNPVQQQVDPKSPAQNRDFNMKGDSAGPKQGG